MAWMEKSQVRRQASFIKKIYSKTKVFREQNYTDHVNNIHKYLYDSCSRSNLIVKSVPSRGT